MSDDLFVPVEFQLPRATKKCAKCGSKASTKTYHANGYLEGVCGRTLGLDAIAHLGDHMDKSCIVCGNEWCEQIEQDTGDE